MEEGTRSDSIFKVPTSRLSDIADSGHVRIPAGRQKKQAFDGVGHFQIVSNEGDEGDGGGGLARVDFRPTKPLRSSTNLSGSAAQHELRAMGQLSLDNRKRPLEDAPHTQGSPKLQKASAAPGIAADAKTTKPVQQAGVFALAERPSLDHRGLSAINVDNSSAPIFTLAHTITPQGKDSARNLASDAAVVASWATANSERPTTDSISANKRAGSINDKSTTSSQDTLASQGGPEDSDASLAGSDEYEYPQKNLAMLLQPSTRPIPPSQLKKEMSDLYGVVNTLEAKCRQCIKAETNSIQKAGKASGTPVTPTSQDQYFRILIGLHRQLGQEYYDLFRASQYASANPDAPTELKNFAARCSLPARLWKHGVHSLLEFLRKTLPDSKEYLYAYILLSYQLFTLLLETVQDFSCSWLECLGDLSRYRMAIEHENPRERDAWLDIADKWYAKASFRQPHLGRLLHHRAILARRNGIWKQQSLYARALTTIEPFDVARGSLETTLYGPSMSEPFDEDILNNKEVTAACPDSFVRLHASDLLQPNQRTYQTAVTPFLKSLQSYIDTVGSAYNFIGETIAITNIAAMMQWNKHPSLLRRIFDPSYSPASRSAAMADAVDCKQKIVRPWYLAFMTTALNLRMLGNEAVLAHIHVMLVFLYCLSTAPSGYGPLYFRDDVHWEDWAKYLNSLQRRANVDLRLAESETFIHPDPEERHLLPEDESLRGLCWTRGKREYLSESHFTKAPSPDEQIQVERQSNSRIRSERILWLAMRIAAVGHGDADERTVEIMRGRSWLRFNNASKMFVVM